MRWRSPAMHTLQIAAVFIGILYLGLFALAAASDRIIFQPPPPSYSDAGFGGQIPILKLKSGALQKTISAVHLPNPGAKYTLVFSHGNGEDIGQDLFLLQAYREAGFAVFAYDYRGYGTSSGRSDENSVYEDAHAAYRYVTEQLHIPPQQVISFGRSLGSAAAIELGYRHPVAGLIVEAPFLSAFRVLTQIPLLPFDKFRNIDKVGKIHCPVLVIHGKADAVVPFWHGQRLYQAANAPKRFLALENAGHNDIPYVASAEYFSALRKFAALLDSRGE